MVNIMVLAMVTGMLGSLHCIGMCGPLALALPLGNRGPAARFTGTLLYNTGRALTYTLLGLVMGLIGQSFALFGLQQYLSIAAGVLIILFLVVSRKKGVASSRGLAPFFTSVRTRIGRLFSSESNGAIFIIGMLNGLLPCGLVYIALASATATGDILESMVFMAFFGLGTLPAMWTLAFFGHSIGLSVRRGIRRFYPYMVTLMACLLILRGMGLGIPYVSPALHADKKVVECCHKPD